jgi:apolipoprotein N-acyltransferase
VSGIVASLAVFFGRLCPDRRGFVLGGLSALLLWLAFPGVAELWPLSFVALLPLLFACRGKTPFEAAGIGLCCGVLHHIILLYWLVTVLGKYGGLPLFIAIPALLLLAFYMALYLGFFTFLAVFFQRRYPALALLFMLPALWVGIDWFRGLFLSGFPWMDLGYALYKTPQLIQIADLAGHHGVTFLLVFINCLIFLLACSRKPLFEHLDLLLTALLIIGASSYYSVSRYSAIGQFISAPEQQTFNVGVVQGNIDQSQKWSPSRQQRTVETYLNLSASLQQTAGIELIVWPETAMPFYPSSSEYTDLVVDYVRLHNQAILSGAPWFEVINREAREIKFYNSALLLMPAGMIGGIYYKSHLVPFGEYVPLKKLLPFLAPLVEAVGDFSPGTIEKPLALGEARIGVLICFESVFPELSRKWVQSGANLLVNLTNDAWYGRSSAPYHSLAMTVFRAVETRRSLVRSANTGISAFIAADGKIISQSEIFVPWAKQSRVVLLAEQTFWVRYGYLFGPLCLAFALMCVVPLFMKKSSSEA